MLVIWVCICFVSVASVISHSVKWLLNLIYLELCVSGMPKVAIECLCFSTPVAETWRSIGKFIPAWLHQSRRSSFQIRGLYATPRSLKSVLLFFLRLSSTVSVCDAIGNSDKILFQISPSFRFIIIFHILPHTFTYFQHLSRQELHQGRNSRLLADRGRWWCRAGWLQPSGMATSVSTEWTSVA